MNTKHDIQYAAHFVVKTYFAKIVDYESTVIFQNTQFAQRNKKELKDVNVRQLQAFLSKNTRHSIFY